MDIFYCLIADRFKVIAIVHKYDNMNRKILNNNQKYLLVVSRKMIVL